MMARGVLRSANYLRRALPAATLRRSTVVAPTNFVASRRHVSSKLTEGLTARRNEDKVHTKKTIEALLQELQYIKDPWFLVRRVEQMLRHDKFDDALALVELASKDMETTVSWNHLIDFLLKKQRVSKAINTFNNMKKRGQFPNAQTYTIMFRGLANTDHPKTALVEAVKLFNLLKNDRRLKPTIIHANALLKVCGYAHDLDMLFVTAAEIEDLGLVPQAATYDTIFSAMRQYIWRDLDNLSDSAKWQNVKLMTERAKGIWKDVIRKWKTGELAVDEMLVCSMGRLLLFGRKDDKLEVLTLLEQTMGLPNFVKEKPKQSERPSIYLNRMKVDQDPEKDQSQLAFETSRKVEERMKLHLRGDGIMPRPGQNTLGLILTTLATSPGHNIEAGTLYWNLLVDQYDVMPDNDNWLRMIGLLSMSKSSAQAAHFVEALPTDKSFRVMPRSFRIAMETCVRDNGNPEVMKYANKILHNMLQRFKGEPDTHTMRLYLRAALVSHSAFRFRYEDGDKVGAKAAYGLQIVTALAELWHPYVGIYNLYFKSEEALSIMKGKAVEPMFTTDKDCLGAGQAVFDLDLDGQREPTLANGPLYNNQREVIALGRMMVGAFSKVIEERMLEDNRNVRDMIIASAQINKGVRAFFEARPPIEPSWSRGLRSNSKAAKSLRTPASENDHVDAETLAKMRAEALAAGDLVPSAKNAGKSGDKYDKESTKTTMLPYDIEMPALDIEFRAARSRAAKPSGGRAASRMTHFVPLKDFMWDSNSLPDIDMGPQKKNGEWVFPPGQSVIQRWVSRHARKRAVAARELAAAERWMYEKSDQYVRITPSDEGVWGDQSRKPKNVMRGLGQSNKDTIWANLMEQKAAKAEQASSETEQASSSKTEQASSSKTEQASSSKTEQASSSKTEQASSSKTEQASF